MFMKSKFHLKKFYFLKMGQLRPLLSFIFGLFKQTSFQILHLQQNNVKMYIQYTVPGFETTIFGTWVSSHNH